MQIWDSAGSLLALYSRGVSSLMCNTPKEYKARNSSEDRKLSEVPRQAIFGKTADLGMTGDSDSMVFEIWYSCAHKVVWWAT